MNNFNKEIKNSESRTNLSIGKKRKRGDVQFIFSEGSDIEYSEDDWDSWPDECFIEGNPLPFAFLLPPIIHFNPDNPLEGDWWDELDLQFLLTMEWTEITDISTDWPDAPTYDTDTDIYCDSETGLTNISPLGFSEEGSANGEVETGNEDNSNDSDLDDYGIPLQLLFELRPALATFNENLRYAFYFSLFIAFLLVFFATYFIYHLHSHNFIFLCGCLTDACPVVVML